MRNMRRLVIAVVLACAPARAEWLEYAPFDEGTVYFDPSTLRKQGDLRTMWFLIDYKKRGPSGELSARLLREFDCKAMRWRALFFTAYAERMAKGRGVELTNPYISDWQDVTPGTDAVYALRFVCAM